MAATGTASDSVDDALESFAVNKSVKAAQVLKEKGAWFLFLPSYTPDYNPIEMAFAKLKAHQRRVCARMLDFESAIGGICDLFSPQKCWESLAAAGYASNTTRRDPRNFMKFYFAAFGSAEPFDLRARPERLRGRDGADSRKVLNLTWMHHVDPDHAATV